jgi:hypothetical protein
MLLNIALVMGAYYIRHYPLVLDNNKIKLILINMLIIKIERIKYINLWLVISDGVGLDISQ